MLLQSYLLSQSKDKREGLQRSWRSLSRRFTSTLRNKLSLKMRLWAISLLFGCVCATNGGANLRSSVKTKLNERSLASHLSAELSALNGVHTGNGTCTKDVRGLLSYKQNSFDGNNHHHEIYVCDCVCSHLDDQVVVELMYRTCCDITHEAFSTLRPQDCPGIAVAIREANKKSFGSNNKNASMLDKIACAGGSVHMGGRNLQPTMVSAPASVGPSKS